LTGGTLEFDAVEFDWQAYMQTAAMRKTNTDFIWKPRFGQDSTIYSCREKWRIL